MIQIFNDKFENVLPNIKFDAIITDPPYPDYMPEEYHYYDGLLDWVKNYDCRQIIFWSAKVDFPLDFTAKHIWDKKCGVGSMYEVIYERNGGKAYKVYNYYLINSTVAASYARDTFYNHPSQKPIGLMRKLVLENTKEGDTIFDPFMGSGSTAIAAIKEGRNFIGCELNPEYFKIVQNRVRQFEDMPTLFNGFEKTTERGQKKIKILVDAQLDVETQQLFIPRVINCPICGSSTTMADPNKCMTPDCPNCIK